MIYQSASSNVSVQYSSHYLVGVSLLVLSSVSIVSSLEPLPCALFTDSWCFPLRQHVRAFLAVAGSWHLLSSCPYFVGATQHLLFYSRNSCSVTPLLDCPLDNKVHRVPHYSSLHVSGVSSRLSSIACCAVLSS